MWKNECFICKEENTDRYTYHYEDDEIERKHLCWKCLYKHVYNKYGPDAPICSALSLRFPVNELSLPLKQAELFLE